MSAANPIPDDVWVTHLHRFLADLKFVASNPNQTQKSFLVRSTSLVSEIGLIPIANANNRYSVFHGEPSERDRRKRAVRFIDSWNHVSFSQEV